MNNDSSSSDSEVLEGFEISSSEMIDVSSSLSDDFGFSEIATSAPLADIHTSIDDWPLHCQLMLVIIVLLVISVVISLFKGGK